ncbi:nuclear body protein SP140-like protein isoform X2 [Phyllobates terribilis]|uniref:nuclear body protein SP140-like protein isoform X2 n=1 Tax=Phyllobates terribilis TaxID=111132 RepID=UPI003CCB3A8A
MDAVYECSQVSDNVAMADIQWFYAKSKVPICLAITDSFHFLRELKDAKILTGEESLELQGDSRTDHRVVYESLCCIEEKDISPEVFFDFLFQKSFLKKYPDLNPVHEEYTEGKYRYGIHSTADTEKDPLIFAQEKVQICLTITDRFPFLHGLQDLTILSESESLKLQADERPVSRVIYESLSLIEKKDMKLNIVFEYIFQECYLKLYPGLQDILEEPNGEFVAPFNGGQYPSFNIATDLLEFFEHNKMYICEAVNERFPFLHGLRDVELLSHIQLLELLADRRLTKEVLYDALCDFQDIRDVESFFAYLFQEFYLKLYPKLHTILNCLNAALTLDVCPPTPVSCSDKSNEAVKAPITDSLFPVMVKNETMEEFEQNCTEPSIVLYGDETNDVQEKDCNEPSRVTPSDETQEMFKQDSAVSPTSSDDALPTAVRKCRLQPISYSEPPDLDLEVKDAEMKRKVSENSKGHKYGRSKTQQSDISFFTQRIHLNDKLQAVRVIKPVSVMVEFPKQVFNEKFRVRCGHKMGVFKKSLWTGDSAKDLCIRCEGKKFSVITFEKYGGKASSKNWKKSIQCEEIRIECLFKAGILKSPFWTRKMKPAKSENAE